MKQQLCELITNFPTVTILSLSVLAVLCLFSILGTVCFLGIFCLLILSVQTGREEGWLHSDQPQPRRRRPRHRTPAPDARRQTRREDRRYQSISGHQALLLYAR